MKSLMRVLVIGTLAGWTAMWAQNFSGSDDFSGGSGNWSGDTASSPHPAAFNVNGGVLNFTAPVLTTFGQSSTVYRDWALNAGSYTADWQVQADFTLSGLSLAVSQIAELRLIVVNNADATDSAWLTLRQNYMTPALRNLSGSFSTDGATAGPSGSASTAATTVTVRASYLAATHQLTLAYDAGSGYANLVGTTVDVGLNWGMGSSDTFGLRLMGSNLINSSFTTSAVVEGQIYADNLLASPSAPVPEPATYAAGLGLLALLAAGSRRGR